MAGLTDRSAPRASLAACLKDAIAPTRAGIAVQILCAVSVQVANAAKSPDGAVGVYGSVSLETILLGYDGSVALAEAAPPSQRLESCRAKPAYVAPELLSGGAAIDRRADVFSMGVVLWELLTGTSLFARESAAATRKAVAEDPILAVRDVNPDVPAVLADVLGAALQRDKNARFDSPEAFGKALAGAAASCGIAAPTKQDLAAWVAERVPPPAAPPLGDVPDLDVPGASRAHRSLPKMEAVKVPSAPALRPPIPAFDVNAMAAAALAPAPARTSSPPDDDDDDMEIERNVAGTSLPTAQSSQPSGHGAARPSGGGRGFELAAPSRMVRERAARDEESDGEPSFAMKLGAFALVTAIGGATAFGLWKYMHHAGGFDVLKSMPHAFDGTSATESGALSLVSFVVAVIVGFVGLRFKPHAWAVIAAGGILLLLALAMVTVTLASTGENPTPPDGALLVPYLFPAAVLMFAIGVDGRAARLFSAGYGARRYASIPLAALAGAIAFFAFEASRFAR